jgi:single-strand DNA-binding protein
MNKVMLIGNVGQDPEVRYVEQGVAVARLRLATTERGYTLQNGTQVPDHTDWHNVILWRKLAEVVEKYVHKGDKLYIEGRIRYTTYDDKQGQRRFMTEIWADNMEMLTPKAVGAVDAAQINAAQPQTAQPQAVQPQAAQPQAEQEVPGEPLPF